MAEVAHVRCEERTNGLSTALPRRSVGGNGETVKVRWTSVAKQVSRYANGEHECSDALMVRMLPADRRMMPVISMPSRRARSERTRPLVLFIEDNLTQLDLYVMVVEKDVDVITASRGETGYDLAL